MSAIRNSELTAADVPDPASGTAQRDAFARTFDGESTWGATLARMANGAFARWQTSAELPPTVTALRACLFFEQRRRNHVGEGIEVEQAPYEDAIYARLQALLHGGVVDEEAATVDAWLKANPGSVAAWVSETANILSEAEGSKSPILEEHLNSALKEVINRERPGCATTRVLSAEQWPSLGNSGVDVVLDDAPGSGTPVLILELKWVKPGEDKVWEALWDLFKTALLVGQYGIRGFLVTAAPTSVWPTAVCADLFTSGTLDSRELFTRQFPNGQPVWNWTLKQSVSRSSDGHARYPIAVPETITVVESGRATISAHGDEWDVRAVSVTPGPGRLPLENGWPAGGRPANATVP